MNEEIDFDTAAIIAEDLGKQVALIDDTATSDTAGAEIDYLAEDPTAELTVRPPVVVVMGHVDHGKTSLLDTVRQADVAAGEAGGITQRIGAYQVKIKDRWVTFIDTPGHEAFSQMRWRGAKVADVAVLVVAAEEGLKPQTTESLAMIKEANLPYLVALTKTDKPEANPERVKKELAENGVMAEEFGGKVPIVLFSAKTKAGLSELLESVLLLADVDAARLQVNQQRPAVGTIIESHVDPQQGPLCSALVQTGTLRLGDEIIVGQVWGKVRLMKNDRGEALKIAPPSTAVQILGLKAAPQVGDIFRVDAKAAQELKKKIKSHQLGHHVHSVVGKRPVTITSKDDEGENKKPQIEKLLVVLKTDTLGSAEAIVEMLKKFHHPEVAVEVVQRGLGIVSEADVMRAEVAHAVIFGFHVQISPKAEQLARSKKVDIRVYDIIYQLIDEVKKHLEALLKPIEETTEIGALGVLAIFRNENTFQVLGGKVIRGQMRQGAGAQIKHGGKIIGQGRIGQLQSQKNNVKEAGEGSECGMKIEGFAGTQVGDEIIATVSEIRQRKLDDQYEPANRPA
jgi:translation initiation factor IF-2